MARITRQLLVRKIVIRLAVCRKGGQRAFWKWVVTEHYSSDTLLKVEAYKNTVFGREFHPPPSLKISELFEHTAIDKSFRSTYTGTVTLTATHSAHFTTPSNTRTPANSARAYFLQAVPRVSAVGRFHCAVITIAVAIWLLLQSYGLWTWWIGGPHRASHWYVDVDLHVVASAIHILLSSR